MNTCCGQDFLLWSGTDRDHRTNRNGVGRIIVWGGHFAHLDSQRDRSTLEGGHSVISPIQSFVNPICSLRNGNPGYTVDGEIYGVFGGKPCPMASGRGVPLLPYQSLGRGRLGHSVNLRDEGGGRGHVPSLIARKLITDRRVKGHRRHGNGP